MLSVLRSQTLCCMLAVVAEDKINVTENSKFAFGIENIVEKRRKCWLYRSGLNIAQMVRLVCDRINIIVRKDLQNFIPHPFYFECLFTPRKKMQLLGRGL